ncbi:MAG: TetR/AcrR family transcriptional regulator [Acidimicrobiia bacterium]|nr:TetR/AcrR family transcriptional regulator [Acidimicrobiia bacterium]
MATRTPAPARTRAARLDPVERRAQLLALGLRMLSSESPDRVPVDEIAEAAGISRGLLFHYFPTKRDFYVAVAQEAARQLLAVTAPDPALQHMDRLHASLAAYVDFVAENEALYVALVRGAAGSDSELQAISEETRSESARRVIEALGMHDPDPAVRMAARGWVGFIEETTLDWLRNRDLDRDQLLSVQKQVLVHALEAAVACSMSPPRRPGERRRSQR